MFLNGPRSARRFRPQDFSPSSPWCNPASLRGGIYIRDSDDSEAV